MTDSQWAPPVPTSTSATVTKPAKGRRLPTALAATIIGLGGAGVVAYLALSGDGGGANGAGTPESVVQGLANAINNEDPIGAMQFVVPDEVEGLADFIQALKAAGTSTKLVTTSDVDLSIDVTSLSTQQLADDVARVSFDIDGLYTAQNSLAEVIGVEGSLDDTIEVSIIVIRQNGGWFASPLLTTGDMLVDALDLPDGDFDEASAERARGSAATPADAVTELFEGAADLDIDAVAGALAAGEARFVRVFGDAIDELVDEANSELDDNGVTFNLGDLSLGDLSGGRVAVQQARVEISDFDETNEVELDDDCLSDRSSEKCLLTNLPLSSPLDEPSFVVHTARQDGNYRVQLVKSLASMGAELVQRLDRATVLELLGFEVLDTPTSLVFGEVTEVEMTMPYQVFEFEVPAGVMPAIDVETTDEDDYINWDQYVLEDGRWQYYYSGDEPSDEVTTVRLVVTPYCSEYADRAWLLGCEERQTPSIVIGASAVRVESLAFPGASTESVGPLERLVFEFTVTDATDAIISVERTDGDSDFQWYLNGPYSYNDDGSYDLPSGDYEIEIRNGVEAGDFTISSDVVFVIDVSLPQDIDSSSPSTTFDLPAGSYVTFNAYAATGDDVIITARPNDGQDIVLNVSSSSGEVCPSTRDVRPSGGEETCQFGVSSGGDFEVYVYGYSGSDEYGSVTVTISYL